LPAPGLHGSKRVARDSRRSRFRHVDQDCAAGLASTPLTKASANQEHLRRAVHR
jgi:hypothetical protein